MDWIPEWEKLWNDWNKTLKRAKQQERLKASFSDECRPFYLSKRTSTATFKGQESSFECRLESNFCNCEEHMYDIHREKGPVPCKYMYRLGRELGLIDENGYKLPTPCHQTVSDDERHDAFRTLVSIIERYDDDTQYALISQCRRSLEWKRLSGEYKVFSVDREQFAPYIKDGILQVVDEPLILLGPQRSLLKRLDNASFVFPDNLARTKAGTVRVRAKYDWCLQHPDIVAPIAYPNSVAVQSSRLLQKGGEFLFAYIRAKFCDTIRIYSDGRKVQYPSGAEITCYETLSYDFPDDIIKEQLDKYGHNRCKNYTEPRETHESHVMAFRFEFSLDDYSV